MRPLSWMPGTTLVMGARRAAVAQRDALACELRRLDHGLRPAREGLAGAVVVEVDVDARGRVEAAGERVGGGGEREVEHALVLRGVGVALLHDVVAPGEVAVELAAGPGGAGHHQAAVPVVGQPQQEPALAGGIVGQARLELEAGHHPGDGRAVRRVGGDDVAVGLGGEGERRHAGERVVGGRGGGIGGGEVRALHAAGVGEPVREGRQHLLTAGGLGGGGEREQHEAHRQAIRGVRHVNDLREAGAGIMPCRRE